MTIDADELANLDEPKPFLEHLEELRRTILIGLGILAVSMAIAVPFAPKLLSWLRRPLNAVTEHPEQFLQSLEVTGGFSIALKTVFWCGLLFSAPFLLLLIGHFVFPGLKPRERRAVAVGLGLAIVLFIGGAALCYVLVLPMALKIMLDLHRWMGIQAWWTISHYVTFVIQLLIAFGLAFELPIVLMTLGYLGIVSSAMLRARRPHAIVILLIVAMLLTPPDVFTQIVMAAPLILLYELCIWAIRLFERRRGQSDAITQPAESG